MKPTDAEILEVARQISGYDLPDAINGYKIIAFARHMIELGTAMENEECEGIAADNCAIGTTEAIRARRK